MRLPFMSILRRHPVAFPAFLLALCLTVVFAVRLAVFTLYWADPDHRAQAPQPWMTPRYIAHSWDLDPKDVAQTIGMDAPIDELWKKRPTLTQIAKTRGVPVEIVINEINTLLDSQGLRQ